MKTTVQLFTGLAVTLVVALAQAQIYQSEDAEGNPVFSDTPSSGASEVELPDANIAKPVEAAPSESVEPGPAAEEAPAEQAWQAPDPDAGPDVIIIGDQTVPLERYDSGDNPRRETSAAEAPESGSAVPRHQTGDRR
jgi:hypothetical protein